jgi:hypothetical protein
MLAFVREVYENDVYETTFRHKTSLASICQELTSEEFQLGLELSLDAIHSVKHSAQTVTYKEALSEELKKVEEKKEREFQPIRNSLEMKIVELQASLLASEQLLSALRQKEEERLASVIQKEEVRNSVLMRQKEEQFERELKRLRDSHDSVLKLIQQNNSEILNRSEKQQKEAVDALKAVLTEQENRLRKEKVSSEKGKQGEKEFASICSEEVPWGSSLINTSKTPHSADLKGRIRSCDVLFEIKSYSTDVPTKEVEKFERDMTENSNVPFGVMISMTSGICSVGRKGEAFLTTRWTANNQLLLFVKHFYEHSVSDILGVIDMCSDLALGIWKVSNKEESSESENILALKNKLDSLKVFIEMEIHSISEFTKHLNHDKKFLTEKVNEIFTRYSSYVSRIRSTLGQMLEEIVGSQASLGKQDEERPEEKEVKEEQIEISVVSESIETKKKKVSKKKTTTM